MIAQKVMDDVQYHGGKLRVMDGELQLHAAEPLPDDLMTMLRLHRSAVLRYMEPPSIGTHSLPPMPRSVRACLSYFGRHPEKELTPKLQAWLEGDWDRIERFERLMWQ